jgi:ATP-binding cassette subfamily C protein CydC
MDNLRVAKPSATERELWHVLAQVNLEERFEHTRDGLNTWIGQTGLALSGGEQRRLTLARTLLRQAQLYILDEPFRGVDAATGHLILPRIEQALSTKTVIWIAHENSVLPRANQKTHLAMQT